MSIARLAVVMVLGATLLASPVGTVLRAADPPTSRPANTDTPAKLMTEAADLLKQVNSLDDAKALAPKARPLLERMKGLRGFNPTAGLSEDAAAAAMIQFISEYRQSMLLVKEQADRITKISPEAAETALKAVQISKRDLERIPPDPNSPEGREAMRRGAEAAKSIKSASNLKMISNGIMLYANEFKGNYPDEIAVLFEKVDMPVDAFKSPKSKSVLPAKKDWKQDEVSAWVKTNPDYLYFGKGKTTNTAGPETVIACENPDAIAGDLNVLYGDGRVINVPRDQALKAIGK